MTGRHSEKLQFTWRRFVYFRFFKIGSSLKKENLFRESITAWNIKDTNISFTFFRLKKTKRRLRLIEIIQNNFLHYTSLLSQACPYDIILFMLFIHINILNVTGRDCLRILRKVWRLLNQVSTICYGGYFQESHRGYRVFGLNQTSFTSFLFSNYLMYW